MIATSVAYQAAIKRSHRAVVTVDVLASGVVVGTLTAVEGSGGAVVAGDVTLDTRAATRGRLALQIVDNGSLGLVPNDARALLAPYGNELRVSRGLVLPSGMLETPGVGVFRIERSRVEDTAGGLAIQVTGMDRSVRVIDDRFEDPHEIAAGTTVETAILELVEHAIPGVVTNFPGVSYVTPTVRAEEAGDRWQLARDLATACGLELYFDEVGTLTLKPTAPGAVVGTFAEGPGGVLLTVARDWSREGSFNIVVATGENTGEAAPARGVARDEDPASPTYYLGPFGRVVSFFQSQFIVTNEQATAAAASILERQLGTTETVEFDVLVDPSRQPGDSIRVTRARAGVDEDHVIDQIRIPLAVTESMTGQTRAIRHLAATP